MDKNRPTTPEETKEGEERNATDSQGTQPRTQVPAQGQDRPAQG